jgi:hypothetical protein
MATHSPFKPVEAIVGDKSRAAHAIWRMLKGPRMAPRREDITLRHVRGLSPWLWMTDVVDNGADFRFRLTGDRIVQFLDGRHVGQLLSALGNAGFYEGMALMLSHCVAHKVPVAVGPGRPDYLGKDHWEMEAVALPLSDDGENVTSLMGAIELWPLGTAPRQHALSHL